MNIFLIDSPGKSPSASPGIIYRHRAGSIRTYLLTNPWKQNRPAPVDGGYALQSRVVL